MHALESDDESTLLAGLAEVTRQSPKALVPRIVALREHNAPAVRDAAKRALVEIAYRYADALATYFHVIPWDEKVLEREDIAQLLKEVCEATDWFERVTHGDVLRVLTENPRRLIVFRLILGLLHDPLTVALEQEGARASAGLIKEMEADGRLTPKRREVLPAVASVICRLVERGAPELPEGASESDFRTVGYSFDMQEGWQSVRRAARAGAPYDVLLYQRYLGGFERQVRDMYSEKKGDLLELPVQKLLTEHGIPCYRTGRTERVPGFSIAPDFLIPDRDSPEVVIEAKIADNGGTARDKASRIRSLARDTKRRGLVLIAVVDGFGFRRHQDVMVPIVEDTEGLTFSFSNLEEMLEVPAVRKYRGQA